MTVASEITRLQWAKSCICSAIVNKWVSVPSGLKLDNYYSCINAIPAAVYLTQAEYDALPSSKLTDWIPYIIMSWTSIVCIMRNWQKYSVSRFLDIVVVWGGWWGWAVCVFRNWNLEEVHWWWWGWWWNVIACTVINPDNVYTVSIWSWWIWWRWNNCKWCDWWTTCFWSIVAIWWTWWCPRVWWNSWSGGSWGAGWWASNGTWWGWGWAWATWGWCAWNNSLWWNWWTWLCWYGWGWGWWSVAYAGVWWAWVDWWGTWWYYSCQSYNATNYGWGWWWAVQTQNCYWWDGCQWVVIVCYKTDWSCWINCATWWTKTTSWDYTVHRFTSDWTFTIVS